MLDFEILTTGALRVRVQDGIDRAVGDAAYQLAFVRDGRAQGFETVTAERVERQDRDSLIFASFGGTSKKMLFVYPGGEKALAQHLRSNGEATLSGGGWFAQLFEPPAGR